jgi:hypothetical protein
MTNEEISNLLPSYLERLARQQQAAPIPLRSDQSEYKIEDLADDQKEALADVLQVLKMYCEGKQINEEQMLRLTLSGVAGSGKSTWIHTLVSTIRKMFPENDTVAVFAPTGSAAFNAGGETLHKGFKLTSSSSTKAIPAKTQAYLQGRFAKTLVGICLELQRYICNKAHTWAQTKNILGVEFPLSY